MTTEPKDVRGGDFAQQNGPKASDPPPVREAVGSMVCGNDRCPRCLAHHPAGFDCRQPIDILAAIAAQRGRWRPTPEEIANARAGIAHIRAHLRQTFGDNPALWSGNGEIGVDIEWLERVCDHFSTPDSPPVSREAVRKRIADLIRDAESDIYWSCEKGRDFDSSALIDAILALTGETSRE